MILMFNQARSKTGSTTKTTTTGTNMVQSANQSLFKLNVTTTAEGKK